MEYFTKANECNKSLEFGEGYLRNHFFHGLTSDNKIEARICGLHLPLDKLVERLSAIENIRKIECGV